MSDGTQPGRSVDVRPAIISTRFPGMNSHAHGNRDAFRPRVRLQFPLNPARRRHRIGGSRKNGEDAVSFATLEDDRAIVSLHFLGDDKIMFLQRGRGFRRMSFPGPSRSFHVRKQESDRSNWTLDHRRHYRKTSFSGNAESSKVKVEAGNLDVRT